MTVTGLPAAADTALSALLSTENLSSWKIDSTGQQTVVVLRFTKSTPFADNAQSRYRLKPPSQCKRDASRLQKHRELMKSNSTYLSSEPHALNVPSDSADNPVTGHCMREPGELPPVTSDPPPSSQCETTSSFKLPPVTSDPTPNSQCDVNDKYKKPADEDDSTVPEKPPPLFHPDEDFLGFRDLSDNLQQLKEKMDGFVECVTSFSPCRSQQRSSETTHTSPTASRDTTRSSQRSGSHGDRPTSTRPQRKKATTRKT